MFSAEPLGHAELTFPAGIVGLPDLTRVSIRSLDGPVVELVSLDDAAFGFLAMPGELARPGLGALLQAEDLAEPGEDVLVILSIHGEPPVVTANRAGPLVITADGMARQLVVEHADLPLRAPLQTSGE